jgi:hypothetical protein
MRWTGQFLTVLTLLSLGCARGDWISETLTLVDVTGTWEGPFHPVRGGLSTATPGEWRTRWVLTQKGGKVKGDVQGLDGAPLGSDQRRFVQVQTEPEGHVRGGPVVQR